MITKRIIPCLDVRDGRVVKGTNFEGLKEVASPVSLARYYSDNGADELVFYDITASAEGRKLFTDILVETASHVFIPLTVGGGISSTADFERVLNCGADKVSVNSGAIKNPDLVTEAAKLYGDQCVVLSVDIKRVDGVFRVFAKGGRENTGMEAIEWIKRCVGNGAGEVVVNSIDTDGTLFQTLPKVDAGLAASIFHFGEVRICDLKRAMWEKGIPTRLGMIEEARYYEESEHFMNSEEK